MKKLISIVVIGLVWLLPGCGGNPLLQPDSPTNTSLLVMQAVRTNDFMSYRSLFSERRKEYASRETFDRLRGMYGGGAEFSHYELVTLASGEMALVRLTPKNNAGRVEVEDVIIVPEEMRKLFRLE
ncbi:conserved hypothetical protein [[Clostridium] ultunense Esp]|uniref:hypothetical protein n=1 Tax=Thermicanus aegyptius TaxID=94009 RepID=UPI0002B6F337|nr:hypothetical protein [Thermicanus aegyptius]CCQ96278.1 conserved hypothetical protein [[Clostridium] ultunense Esp]